MCPLHSFFWRFCIAICMMCNVFSFFLLLCRSAEKASFRFNPAYPRPDSASSDAQKYLFPVLCIHICTCVGSKTAKNPRSQSPNLSLKSNLCEILYRLSYLEQGVNKEAMDKAVADFLRWFDKRSWAATNAYQLLPCSAHSTVAVHYKTCRQITCTCAG